MFWPYNHIDELLGNLIRFLDEGRLSHWLEQAPAQLGTFFATNPAASAAVQWAQITAAFLSAIFAFVIFVALIKTRALETAPSRTGEEASKAAEVSFASTPSAIQQRWDEVRKHLDSPHEAEWKLAVMEGDKLVNDALMKAGFAGETFGDRLMNMAPGTLQSLDGLWWAHKVRNRLAHEMDYFLRYTEAKQSISYYEQTLRELQLLS